MASSVSTLSVQIRVFSYRCDSSQTKLGIPGFCFCVVIVVRTQENPGSGQPAKTNAAKFLAALI